MKTFLTSEQSWLSLWDRSSWMELSHRSSSYSHLWSSCCELFLGTRFVFLGLTGSVPVLCLLKSSFSGSGPGGGGRTSCWCTDLHLLADPAERLCDTSVNARLVPHRAADSPAGRSDQLPHGRVLAGQRAAAVALTTDANKQVRHSLRVASHWACHRSYRASTVTWAVCYWASSRQLMIHSD